MAEDLLLDADLVPDPYADSELGPAEAQPIADTALAGARIQLVRTALERVDLDDGAGAALALAAVFHAPPAARFSFGEIRWKLLSPAEAVFLDVAPVSAPDGTPVTFTIGRSGKLGLSAAEGVPVAPNAELAAETKKQFTVYHCAVKASGAASRRALWTLAENPDTQQGIGHSTQLAVTLRGSGEINAEVLVSARLIKPGVAGRLAEIRDLILGPALSDRPTHRIRFAVPAASGQRSGWFRLFGRNGD